MAFLIRGATTRRRSRSRAEWLGLASQVGLALGLITLAVAGRWLANEIGIASILGGAAALFAATTWWWRFGGRPALILVDLWFVAYGLLLIGGGPALPEGGDGGAPQDVLRATVSALGGPLGLVGDLWFVAGLLGALAAWHSAPRTE